MTVTLIFPGRKVQTAIRQIRKYQRQKVIEKFMEQQPQLNDHNKQEYPPMHIVEMNTSLINQL